MLKEFIHNFLEAIAPLLAVIGFLCTAKRWSRTRHLQLLFLYFSLACFNLGVATWLAFVNKPNILWYNINGFTSLAALSAFFYYIIETKRIKTIIASLAIAGLVTYLLLLFVWDDNITFFSAGYSIGSLLVIAYCFLFLKEVFGVRHSLSLESGSIVWIVSGLLTYFIGSYLIQVTYKLMTVRFLKAEKSVFLTPGVLWGVHNVIYCLTCAFIVFHLLKMRPELESEKA